MSNRTIDSDRAGLQCSQQGSSGNSPLAESDTARHRTTVNDVIEVAGVIKSTVAALPGTGSQRQLQRSARSSIRTPIAHSPEATHMSQVLAATLTSDASQDQIALTLSDAGANWGVTPIPQTSAAAVSLAALDAVLWAPCRGHTTSTLSVSKSSYWSNVATRSPIPSGADIIRRLRARDFP
jgi:hypothetical protein